MSSSYPAGTVTFLFTDIEGSTKLLQELGADYGAVVSEARIWPPCPAEQMRAARTTSIPR